MSQMSQELDKISLFEQEINAEAKADVDSIMGEAKKQADAMLREADERCVEECYQLVSRETARLKAEMNRQISRESFAAGRETVAHRNKLVDELFSEVKDDIQAYTGTKEYLGRLEKDLKSAHKQRPFYTGVKVMCRAADRENVERILKKLSLPAEVQSDKSIALGGMEIRYPKENISIDKTLDEAFRVSRENFATCKELRL